MARNEVIPGRSFGSAIKDMQRQGEAVSVFSPVGPDTNKKGKPIVLVSGLITPEFVMHPLGKRLDGHTYDLEHYIPANIVVGIKKRIREKLEEVTDETGERANIVGLSLGGYHAASAMRDNPDLVERVVSIGSPILGVTMPKDAHAESIFTFPDTIVPWPLSLNPGFKKHHGILVSTHFGIVFRKDVAHLVQSALTNPTTSEQDGLSIERSGIIVSLRGKINEGFLGSVGGTVRHPHKILDIATHRNRLAA